MMRVVKPVNRRKRNVITRLNLYKRLLKVGLWIGFSLFFTMSHAQNQEPLPLSTPYDILTCFSLNWNGHFSKETTLSSSYHKWPNLLFSLGQYHHGALWYTMIETKHAYQNTALQLYSLGSGYRQLFSFGMLGGYLFLDLVFKEQASLWHLINLCNLNVGLEVTLPYQYQLIANGYIPLRSYDYIQKECHADLKEDNQASKNYIVTQPYYIESGNLGFDINLCKVFFLGKHPLRVTFGGYAFNDRYKKIQMGELDPFERDPRVVIGGAHTLTWQCSHFWSVYYKITWDNTVRSWCLSAGIRWQLSTHNPINLAHHSLWLPPIDRHLSPLLAAEKISRPQEKSELYRRAFLKRCTEAYQGDQLQAIKDTDRIIWESRGQSLYEYLYPDRKGQEAAFRRMICLIHPDKSGDPNSPFKLIKDIIMGKNGHALYDHAKKGGFNLL